MLPDAFSNLRIFILWDHLNSFGEHKQFHFVYSAEHDLIRAAVFPTCLAYDRCDRCDREHPVVSVLFRVQQGASTCVYLCIYSPCISCV